MKKILLLVLIVLVSMVGGCVPETKPIVQAPIAPVATTPKTIFPLFSSANSKVFIDVSPNLVVSTTSGKIIIGNYYGGARAETTVIVTNHSDRNVTIRLSYVDVDVAENVTSLQDDGSLITYTLLPKARDWVTFQSANLSLCSGSVFLIPNDSKTILVVLETPKEITVPERWEFRVLVNNESQTGMYQVAFNERFLVNMR